MTAQDGGSKETATATPVAVQPMGTFDPSQLPVAIAQESAKRGELVNREQLTAQQTAKAKQLVEKFNLNDSTAVLTFAAAPQKSISAFLDQLMDGVKVRDVGVAGLMAEQMSNGIDLLALDKVKKQIKSGVGVIGHLGQQLHILTNWVKHFYLAQMEVQKLIDQMEAKANNRIVSLDGHVKKLDQLADQSVVQVRELAVWIVAGEMILDQARQQYQRRYEAVFKTRDVVELSRLRDMERQVAALEKRVLETEIAYTNAGNVTIPQIRMVQEADRIEIQNISEQILFQLPKFKTAIVMMAALVDTKAAADDRKRMDANERKLDSYLTDTIAEAERLAKESQGDPLQKVADLETNIAAMVKIINDQIEIEKQTHQKREEAHDRLVAIKDEVGNALVSANLQAAGA